MSRRLTTLGAVLLGCAATLAAQATAPAKPQRPDQDAPAPIRVAVDVVAVDVQVIDRAGRPVPDLGPEKFTVTINGRRRRVVSAERIGTTGPDGERSITPGSASGTMLGRVIMIAVDCISFDATASRGVIQSVRQFLTQLSPDDFVGLSALPNGARVNPTQDHAAVMRALDTVVGQRDLAEISQFHVRPSEIVDITRELNQGGGSDARCDLRQGMRNTGRSLLPDPAHHRRAGYRPLLRRPGHREHRHASLARARHERLPRPQDAAPHQRGDDRERHAGRTPRSRRARHTGRQGSRAREHDDLHLVHRDERHGPLCRPRPEGATGVSSTGAATARCSVDGWSSSRVPREEPSSASRSATPNRRSPGSVPNCPRYYLLGVEPGDDDRDGRTHEIAVKTTQPNVTVRGRRWVMVPKRTATAPGATPASGASVPATPTTPAPAPSEAPARRRDSGRRAVACRRLRSRQLRRDAARLARSTELCEHRARIPHVRQPVAEQFETHRRVRAGDGARRTAQRQHPRARGRRAGCWPNITCAYAQPAGADAFECAWFLTEAAALEGLFMPDSALLFIPRALQRCPTSPTASPRACVRVGTAMAARRADADQELEIVRRYEEAMKFPETEAEARVRAARFLYGLGQLERGLGLLNGATRQSTDKEVRYLAHLVRGQLLRARGRSDDAAAAFRAALVIWPGAQSARVALMTLLVSRGNRAEAATLAEAAQTASDDQFDPWWTYWLGDYRAYPAMLGQAARARTMTGPVPAPARRSSQRRCC